MDEHYQKVLEQVVKALEARFATLEAQVEVLKARQRRQQPAIIIFKGKKQEGGE